MRRRQARSRRRRGPQGQALGRLARHRESEPADNVVISRIKSSSDREAVAAVGDFTHPTSLPRNRAPDPDRYPDNTAALAPEICTECGQKKKGGRHKPPQKAKMPAIA